MPPPSSLFATTKKWFALKDSGEVNLEALNHF
jgi:hypothetical protein